MVFVIDIDDTILVSERCTCEKCNRITYKNATPILDEIDSLNLLYDMGHTIILHTGRNWKSYKLTVIQLKELGVKYHNLIMGKPQGFYIDRTHNFSSVSQCLSIIKKGIDKNEN